jgi:hypothetical protein
MYPGYLPVYVYVQIGSPQNRGIYFCTIDPLFSKESSHNRVLIIFSYLVLPLPSKSEINYPSWVRHLQIPWIIREDFEHLYGLSNMSLNVHPLLHACDCVKNWGHCG